MKKIVFIFAVIFCLAIYAYAQNDQQETIAVTLFPKRYSLNKEEWVLRFNREGKVSYIDRDSKRTVASVFTFYDPIIGTYHLERVETSARNKVSRLGQNNKAELGWVVHITWNNGYQETAQIRYVGSKAVCTFRGLIFEED